MTQITLMVSDLSGLEIPGAKVTVVGTTKTFKTKASGKIDIDLVDGNHKLRVEAFGKEVEDTYAVPGGPYDVKFEINPEIRLSGVYPQDPENRFIQGEIINAVLDFTGKDKRDFEVEWSLKTTSSSKSSKSSPKLIIVGGKANSDYIAIDSTSLDGQLTLSAKVTDKTNTGESLTTFVDFSVRGDPQAAIVNALVAGRQVAGGVQSIASNGVTVDMERSRRSVDPTLVMFEAILETTNSLSFNNYKAFMDYVLCNDDEALKKLDRREQERITGGKTEKYEYLRDNKRYLPFTDTDSYRLLKIATEAFLIVNCGIPLKGFVDDDLYEQLLDKYNAEDGSGKSPKEFWKQHQLLNVDQDDYIFPYLSVIYNKLPDVPVKRKIFSEESFNPHEAERCYGIIMEKLYYPCMIELIWNYWIEEGMAVQTINSISRRFQNVRGPQDRDPLANVETDPLRPLNNLLWGYVQDEQHRLSVLRRAYEYDHHYGLSLEGDAVPALRTADSRSRFLEAFHQMLQQASYFYKQDDDTTMVADGFALLNALRDLHMILSEGAHNQYGDLPTTARIEMMMEQWLMSRPEFRELLPTRTMVAYPEPWMDRVDAMKRIQGWTDTSITHFRFLAIYGEQILLSVRFTNWSEIDDADLAAVWARFFRNQVKGYVHAYRAVTGVDLSAETTTSQQQELFTTRPSVLLQRRLQNGNSKPALTPGAKAPQGFRQRRPARRTATTD